MSFRTPRCKGVKCGIVAGTGMFFLNLDSFLNYELRDANYEVGGANYELRGANYVLIIKPLQKSLNDQTMHIHLNPKHLNPKHQKPKP